MFCPPHPCLTPPIGDPVRISGWNLPRKIRWIGLLSSGNSVILTSTFLTDPPVWQTDGQTYGIAIAYTCYSIYAVARKNEATCSKAQIPLCRLPRDVRDKPMTSPLAQIPSRRLPSEIWGLSRTSREVGIVEFGLNQCSAQQPGC